MWLVLFVLCLLLAIRIDGLALPRTGSEYSLSATSHSPWRVNELHKGTTQSLLALKNFGINPPSQCEYAKSLYRNLSKADSGSFSNSNITVKRVRSVLEQAIFVVRNWTLVQKSTGRGDNWLVNAWIEMIIQMVSSFIKQLEQGRTSARPEIATLLTISLPRLASQLRYLQEAIAMDGAREGGDMAQIV